MALKDYDTTDIWKELKRRETPATYRQMYHKLLEVAVELLATQEVLHLPGHLSLSGQEEALKVARRKYHEMLVRAVNA